MSWHSLLNELDVTKGKITKVSPDGKQVTVQTSPGQELKIDTAKDDNIDISTDKGKTSIKLNKKSGPNVGPKVRPGQSVDISEDFMDDRKYQSLEELLAKLEDIESHIYRLRDMDGATEWEGKRVTGTGDIHDQLTTMYKSLQALQGAVGRALKVVPGEQNPDIQKFKAGMKEGFGDNATATQALRLMVGSQNFAKAKRALEMARAGKSVPANFVSGLIPLLDLLNNVMSGSIANTRILQQLDKRAKQKLNIADSVKEGVNDVDKIHQLTDELYRELVDFNNEEYDENVEELVGHLAEFKARLEGDTGSFSEGSVKEAGGNMEGYLNTIDEYVEMLFKSAKDKRDTEIAYRIQNAVDDIRTRELGLKPSLIRAKYNTAEAVQKKRLVDTGLDLEEGPNDKHIFKAIFMAGGPGSGKSFVAQKVLKQFGLKVIDSDKMFEYLMSKKGMDVNDPEQIYSPDGQATRDKAKAQTAKQKHWWLDGKLGVVIDGTGRDVEKTAKLRQEMIDQGYGTMMLYVNTKLAVAQQRNLDRPGRTIRPEEVEKMWRRVQENIMKFQQVFGAERFLVIDNSGGLEDPERAEAFKNVESNIRKFLNQEPRNKIAQKWLAQYKK